MEITHAKLITRGLIVIGLIILLVLIGAAVSSVGKKNNSQGFFSSLFSAISLSRESLTVSLSSAEASSGSAFTLSWIHEKRTGSGSYDLMYACRVDAALTLPNGAPIPCNSAFSLGDTSSVSLNAVSTSQTPVSIDISVEYTPEGASKPSIASSASLSVTPQTNVSTTPAPQTSGGQNAGTRTGGGVQFGKKTTTTYPGGTRIDPNGKPDLVVAIIDVGVLIGATTTDQTFQHSNSIGINQQPAIVFDIKNVGANVSGDWKFKANLPTASATFISDTQASLTPGNGVRFTLGFQESIKNSGSNPLTITVDPDNTVSESSESNNSATTTIVRGY